MRRFAGAFFATAVLVGAIFLVLAPASLADNPRGIWCNGSAALTLPSPDGGFVTIPPFWAVNVEIDNGKALGAAGLVTRANFLPGVGAFCPGDSNPLLAGKTFTPVLGSDGKPLIVNNLGQSLPGDGGAIYVLVKAG